jgi:hypothetical protein
MPVFAMLRDGAAHFLLQGVLNPENLQVERWDPWIAITTFINTPAPYSPFTEYLAVLFILWLLARRHHRKRQDFAKQAQEVLDRKYEEGELSESAYEKFRQDHEAERLP